MTDENTLVAEPTQVIPADNNWVEGISSNESVCKVASRVLETRLKAICHWLPLASENSDEDIEYVHQLRLSVRRAEPHLQLHVDLPAESAPAAEFFAAVRTIGERALRS